MTLALLLTAATGAWATDYTTLAVGDVIKVGDTFTPTADGAFGDDGVSSGVTYTLIRADVDNGVTEKTDGAYYVFKFVSDLYSYIHFGKAFEVTATSDGLVVTNIVTEKGKQSYALAVHEPAPAATPVDIDWDAATPNTATLTNGMPAGNVTVSVEYFPQAEFAMSTDATPVALAPTAIADVPATTDGPIVNPGTVKNIGTSEVKQGTLMYYVSTTPMTNDDLLALTPDKWSADVPTAESLAEGQAYVYYYIKGAEPATIAERTDANTCSDGDILAANVVNVTLAAAPLWNAEFDLTDAPEADKAGKWSTNIPEGGVVKGTPVTVTYTGSKKIIGVKAEKKAAVPAAEGHALSASAVGEIVGSDGNVYAVADKDNLPDGVTAVAMVAYKSATAGSSLAIALADEGSMNWNSAKGTCASKAAIGGKSWKLPTKDEWDQMFSANGGSTGLKTALSAAGGASSTLQNGNYWSSTDVVLVPEEDPDMAWLYSFGDVRWYYDNMVNGHQVRACLAF